MLTEQKTIVRLDAAGVEVSRKTDERELFKLDELDDRAQGKAYDRWYTRCMEDPDLLDCAVENLPDAVAALGVEFATNTVKLYGGGTREKPRMYYSVGGGQGDGASWEGWYKYRRGSAVAVPKEYGEKLGKIAVELFELQRRHFFKLTAQVSSNNVRACHSNTMHVTVYRGEDEYSGEDAQKLIDLLRASADWVYAGLQAELDDCTCRERFAEECSELEQFFDADGNRA
jgi:hypothetical protein